MTPILPETEDDYIPEELDLNDEFEPDPYVDGFVGYTDFDGDDLWED